MSCCYASYGPDCAPIITGARMRTCYVPSFTCVEFDYVRREPPGRIDTGWIMLGVRRLDLHFGGLLYFAPGCRLQVEPILAIPNGIGGATGFPFTMASVPSGLEFHLQYLALRADGPTTEWGLTNVVTFIWP